MSTQKPKLRPLYLGLEVSGYLRQTILIRSSRDIRPTDRLSIKKGNNLRSVAGIAYQAVIPQRIISDYAPMANDVCSTSFLEFKGSIPFIPPRGP